MSKPITLIFFILFSSASFAQDSTKRYFVSFNDKAGSQYNLEQPQEFLSDRSIQRRKRQNIPIVNRDLPVSQKYIHLIKNIKAVKFWFATKWFNGVIIESDDASILRIKKLPFVKNTILLKSISTDDQDVVEEHLKRVLPYKPSKVPPQRPNVKSHLSIVGKEDYGKSFNQAKMLEAEKMHEDGFRGQGMIIAVFDAGFDNVDNIKVFDHLFQDKRILGIYDFVRKEKSVFEDDAHGRMALSCMAAYDKGKMVGTAPEASYFLFRTEDADTEYRVEEFNWLRAAEVADSLGVDVINSSLGYNYFNDKNMDYTYKDLDGKTAYITQAAEIASSVGMIVVTSAGNEGNNSWKYVTAPADAPSALSIGAVNPRGKYAGFSSKGYTVDRRIKPDLVAQGHITTVASLKKIGVSSGTSFSSPVMAGFVTSFWGGYPHLTAKNIMDILRKTADHAAQPDSTMGYGIPSYTKAKAMADTFPKKNISQKTDTLGKATIKAKLLEFKISPSPQYNYPIIQWGHKFEGKEVLVTVYNTGLRELSKIIVSKVHDSTHFYFLHLLPKGTYYLSVTPDLYHTEKIKFDKK